MEEPVPDRHFCIHEQLQPHDLCPNPCPYSLDQPHPTLEYAPAPQYMDLNNIFDFPDVMTTTSDEDILSLEDVYRLWKWTLVCINFDTHGTPHMKQDKFICKHHYTMWLRI